MMTLDRQPVQEIEVTPGDQGVAVEIVTADWPDQPGTGVVHELALDLDEARDLAEILGKAIRDAERA